MVWSMMLEKCLFTFFKSLACLALQTEIIIKKIKQPKLPKMKKELTKICNEPGMNGQFYRDRQNLEAIKIQKSIVFSYWN